MSLFLAFGSILQINGEEVLVKMLIFDFSIDYRLVKRYRLSTARSHIVKNEQAISFKVSSESLVGNRLLAIFLCSRRICQYNIYSFLVSLGIFVNRVSL